MDETRGLLRDDAAIAAFQAQSMAQYGIHANAEEMIAAHRASVNPALTKAQLLPDDAEATEEAMKDLKGSAKKLNVPEGAELLSCAVKGNALIGVIEYPDGTTRKLVAGANENYRPPRLTSEQAELQATAESSAAMQREVEQLRAKYAQELADTAAELQEQMSKEVERIREENAKELESAREAQAKAAEKDDRPPTAAAGGQRTAAEKKGESSGAPPKD